jgi:hypothetical protein
MQKWEPNVEIEPLAEKRAERRSKDMTALREARAIGFEPKDVEAYMERVFDGPVRSVPPSAPAQKKTPLKSPFPMRAHSRSRN